MQRNKLLQEKGVIMQPRTRYYVQKKALSKVLFSQKTFKVSHCNLKRNNTDWQGGLRIIWGTKPQAALLTKSLSH